MIAVISDIHGNLAALAAVLGDLAGFPVDKLICLGDIVGYGPDPELCTDLIMEHADVTLMGNHDFALLHGPEGFNPVAASVIYLTQERMAPGSVASAAQTMQPYECTGGDTMPRCLVQPHTSSARWEYLSNLIERFTIGDLLFVHASPLDPIIEYVFPDVFAIGWRPERILQLMESFNRVCFCGHTHIPCAIDSSCECIYPAECDYRWALDPNRKYIINPGSVGQPRDHDPRASYALFDEHENMIEWRRIEYDIAATVEKSEAMCGKDNWCAKRLIEGR